MTPVSSLAAVELRCPDLGASRDFFRGCLGLIETDRSEDHSRLRGFGEWHDSLILRRDDRPGLAHLTWYSGDAAEAVAPAGHRVSWSPEAKGSRSPGHLPNQPSPRRGVGIEPRRLAHVGLMVEDLPAEEGWWVEELGLRTRETVEGPSGATVAALLSAGSQVCDLMLLAGPDVGAGALHHVAFAVDGREGLADAGSLLVEHGAVVEAGLGKHGVGEISYLYAFEPSGNRIALVHSPLVVLDADERPVRWPAERSEAALMRWGSPLGESFFTTVT